MIKKKQVHTINHIVVALLLFTAIASLAISTLSNAALPLIAYVFFSFAALYCVVKALQKKRGDFKASRWIVIAVILGALLTASVILAYPLLSILGYGASSCDAGLSGSAGCFSLVDWRLSALRMAGIMLVPVAIILSALAWSYSSKK